jgi:DNA mismatch repair protein MutL
VNVTGYISTPHQTRSNRSHITLFVNGRNVQDQRLSYAVVQGYHGLIPQGRYPVAVLMITLDPSEVDVNVHPTKAEVRFRHPDAVFSALQRAVRETLQQGTEVREIASATFIPSYSPPPPNYAQTDLSLELDDAGRRPYETRPADADEADFLRHIPEGVSAPAQPRTLPPMRIIGQLAAMYILAEAPAGLYLIDQHAAHERILYEQFLRQAAQQKLPAQRTLQGSLLRLPPASMKLLEEHLPTLAALGFELEPFGTDTFQVRAIPALLADYSPEDVLGRILQDLEDEAQPGQKNLEDKILRRVCKTAAVKAGQLLSYDEMLGLLRQLERCETPLTCPHGRPTLIHLSKSDLAREFGRT